MVILIDNSSARMLLRKSGCSRVRHLDCRLLWTQQAVQEGRFKVGATPTRLNLADLGTKPLGQDRVLLLLGLLGYCNAEGPRGKSQIENQERAHRVAVMCRRVPNSRQMHGLFAMISALSLADGVTGVEGTGDASNSINSNPKIIASLAWLKHASSTASELHSSRLSSVPTHFTLFAATGEPLAPHQLPLPHWPHGEGLATPKS